MLKTSSYRFLPQAIESESIPLTKTLNPALHVPDYLLLPFGRAVKSDLEKIRLTAVSTDGLYMCTGGVSVIFIHKRAQQPLCLGEFERLFGDLPPDVLGDDEAILDCMCNTIKSHNPGMTPYEERFLDLYFRTLTALMHHAQGDFGGFKKISEEVGLDWRGIKRHKSPNDVWRALLPIPELQVYVRDPLAATGRDEPPDKNLRVDYAFWDGTQLTAVEIDGYEPSGYGPDVQRDRCLRHAGLDPKHILNGEVAAQALQRLLPSKFFGHDWDYEGQRPGDIPF